MEIDKITSIYAPSLSPSPLAPGRSLRGLHICTHSSNNNPHLMMGISKEKSLRTHHQHQYIHAGGATLDNKWTYDPFTFGHGFLKTEARILGFGDVRVQNTRLVSELISELILELILELITELVMEFTGGQTEMIKETVVEAIAGTIMAMIAELTEDWIGDWIGNQSEMILELVSELIPELIGDPDGCPLTDLQSPISLKCISYTFLNFQNRDYIPVQQSSDCLPTIWKDPLCSWAWTWSHIQLCSIEHEGSRNELSSSIWLEI